MHDPLSRPLLPDLFHVVAEYIPLQPRPKIRQFVVQHLYADTLRLLEVSHRYYPIDVVIRIAYSGDERVVERLRDLGIRVLTPSADSQEAVIREALAESLKRAQADGAKLMIHEVGGAAFTCMHRHFSHRLDDCIGAVEITHQGVWMAQALSTIQLPQLNCAQTRLKEIEGDQVGEAVVSATDRILRQHGRTLAGRQSLVLGYGWVGRGVARALKARGAIVRVKEPDTVKAVAATLAGFLPYAGSQDLGQTTLVLGAAGVQSITGEILDALPHGAVLGSGSSKQVEIDLAHLLQNQTFEEASIEMPPHLHAVSQRDGRTLYVMNRGFPVNFTGPSVADEVVAFLFAEALWLMGELADGHYGPGIWPLSAEAEADIARLWLDTRHG